MKLFKVEKGVVGIVIPPEGRPYVKEHASDTIYDLESVVADPIRVHNDPVRVRVDLLNLTQDEWRTEVIFQLAKDLAVFYRPGNTTQRPYFFATFKYTTLG